MKILFYISLLICPAFCQADTFQLRDGAKIEGEVTGEMEGVIMLKTKYGALTINRSDILEQQAAAPAAAPAAAQETAAPQPAPSVSTAAAVIEHPAPALEAVMPVAAVSTETLAAIAAELEALPPAEVEPGSPAPGLSFRLVMPSSATRQMIYLEDGVAIATETFGDNGPSLSFEGTIKDGIYTEYYPDGAVKTVKPMSGGMTSGAFKTFYASGKIQVEAQYLAGAKNGMFRYFSEEGKPLMEASYAGDKLNGLKKEYGQDGTVRSEVYYENDRPTELPKLKDTAGAPQEQDSMVTAAITLLARGERYTFRLNRKYLGKIVLDKNFNVTSQAGKVPDGAARVYSSEGKLQKELLFKENDLKVLRVFEDGGPLKATYTYDDGKAKAFALR